MKKEECSNRCDSKYMITCPVCYGTGKSLKKYQYTCTSCNGKGKIKCLYADECIEKRDIKDAIRALGVRSWEDQGF